MQVTEGLITSVSQEGRDGATPAHITVDVNKLTLGDKERQTVGRIESSTTGVSAAGKITITASEYINIFGNNSGIFSTSGEENNTQATGNAGKITLGEKTKPVLTLRLDEGGKISTTAYGTGDSGSIELFVDDLQITEGLITSVSQEGRDGATPANITVDVNKLTLGDKQGNTGGHIVSSTDGASPAGKITITASEYIKIYTNSGIFSTADESATEKAGQIIIGSNSNPVTSLILEGGEINTTTWGLGQGGEIDLNVNTLEITEGGRIESSTENDGPAGTITITASENIKIVGNNSAETTSGIFSETNSTEATAGDAGTITIGVQTSGTDHPALLLTKNGRISTTTSGTGQGGEIELNLNSLEITEGGSIESSTTDAGSAGTITITASEYINIWGGKILSTALKTGNAGEITIEAGNQFGDTKDIREFIDNPNDIKPLPFILAEEGGLSLQEGGEISTSTQGEGEGGKIEITTSQLELKNQASISATSKKAAIAGNIVIGTNLLNMSGSTISTSSAASEGGDVLIGVRKVNNKRITNSTLSAKAGERGDGGNLEIRGKPEYLILDNTDLIAKAEQGDGGQIEVDANLFIASGDSEVSASSNKGIDGEVNIDSAQIDVESISLLPSRPVDASKLIKDCVASDSEEEWSLVQVGYEVTTLQNRTGCVK